MKRRMLITAVLVAALAGCTAGRPDPIPAPIAGPSSAPPPAGITARRNAASVCRPTMISASRSM